MTTENTLLGALLTAQGNIGGVGKDATNSFHKYNYTSAEQMIGSCRKVLNEAGLVIYRKNWTPGEPFGQNGERMIRATFVVAHPESGQCHEDEVTWPAVPDKGRPLDKAMAVALTTALSYWLRDLLLVPRNDDTMDERDDANYQPPAVIDSETLGTVNSLVEEAGSDPREVASYFHVSDLSQLPQEQAPKVIKMLRTKISKQKNETENHSDSE